MTLESTRTTESTKALIDHILTNSMQNFYLKKINNKKKLYSEEKIAENKNNLKELWRTLKSLSVTSQGGGKRMV